ncbi:MAG: glycosyltransferase, partial [Woeseia sp.]
PPDRRLIKVMHVITGDLYAGAERVQDLLASRLPEFGYEVTFACLKEGAFQQRLLASSRDVRSIVMKSRLDIASTTRGLVAHARNSGAELIHTHTVRGALLGSLTALITGLPMVHHVHSPTARDTTNRWGNRLNTVVEKLSLRRACALIPVSNSLAHYLAECGHPDTRISTVHNGVPASDLSALRVAGRPLTIGMVALFRPRKGIEVLLHAMSHLMKQGLSIQLRAVGQFENSTYRQQVMSLSEQLGLSSCVEWRGFRADVLPELTHMDVLVLPSLFGEGLPMVVLEAMAVGLPVVASAVEGLPEAIRDGDEGLLVPPDNPVALAMALISLVEEPQLANRMGIAGRQRQREMFSDAAMARDVSGIYGRVLARGSTRQSAT